MDYSIAYTIEYLLHVAGAHKWMAVGVLALLVLAILYNVIKQQYAGQAKIRN